MALWSMAVLFHHDLLQNSMLENVACAWVGTDAGPSSPIQIIIRVDAILCW